MFNLIKYAQKRLKNAPRIQWGFVTIAISIIILMCPHNIWAKNVDGALGICTIHAPKRNTTNNSDGTVPSTYDYVYFGNPKGWYTYPINGSYSTGIAKKGPLKFRVLDTLANDETTKALFLLQESPIGYRSFYNSSTQAYDTSTNCIRGCLYNYIYPYIFTPGEQNVLKSLSKTDKCVRWSGSYSKKTGESNISVGENVSTSLGTSYDYIFLLSAEELLNPKYGFCSSYNATDVNKKIDELSSGGLNTIWWLRSAYSGGDYYLCSVSNVGIPTSYSYDRINAIRFGMNVDLTKILFTQDVTDQGLGSLSEVKDRENTESSEFKLTLYYTPVASSFSCTTTSFSPAPSSNANSSANPTIMTGGGKVTAKYSNATNGDNMYISAIIKRTGTNYTTLSGGNYYGVLKKVATTNDKSGTVELTIPVGIPAGDYIVNILNEQKNGAHESNYANKSGDFYIKIQNTVASTAVPTVVNVHKNEHNTAFLVEAKDDGILQKIQYGGDNNSKEVEFLGQSPKKNFIADTAINSFKIYNKAGLYTTVQSSSCIMDRKPPVVTKTEESFKWKLTMWDNTSGLWKITDSTGEEIVKDYSGDGYPKTEQTFVVPYKYDAVRVYDGVGNYTTVQTYAQEVVSLGHTGIVNPVWSGDYKESTKYNKVYFGWRNDTNCGYHFSDNTKSVLFRVLNTTANDDEHTPALFLLSEYVSITTKTFDPVAPIWNTSGYSEIRTSFNTSSNNSTYKYIWYDCFNNTEQDVIMNTKKTEEEGDVKWHFNGVNANPKFYCAGAADILNEKLFLLSAKEVTDPRYGFSNITYPGRVEGTCASPGPVYWHDMYKISDYKCYGDQSSRAQSGGSGGGYTSWWLRSPVSEDRTYVGYINDTGVGQRTGCTSSLGVRFALNIPLSKVIAAQNAELTTSSPTSSTFTSIQPRTSNNPCTLTICNGTKASSMNILETETAVTVGETVTLTYYNISTSNYYSIMAIIKRTDDNGITKGWIAKGEITSGNNVSFTLPNNIEPGTYKMVVYNEYTGNGAYKTNTATYDTLTLKILPKTVNNAEKTEGICTVHKARRNATSSINGTTKSTYDYVYFGKLDGRKQYNKYNTWNTSYDSYSSPQYKSNYIRTGPLKFRVLDTTSNDEATPALFMLTDYPIGYRYFSNSYNYWTNSWIKPFLNGTSNGGVLKDCFDDVEREAIASTTKRQDWSRIWNGSYSCYNNNGIGNYANSNSKLANDKIFLLSAEEALNTRYGFSTINDAADINRKVDELDTGGLYTYWWLRSSVGSSYVASASNSGAPGYSGYTTSYAVRFALNIPLANVLLTQDANYEKVESLSLIKNRQMTESSEFKLTILDNRTNSPRVSFKATAISPTPVPVENSKNDTIEMLHGGNKITIAYEGAATGDNEYISAIIRRTSDDYLMFEKGNYYGVLKKSNNSSGEVELVIPEGIPEGKYTVMILNEQINGAYNTNYAKKFNIYIDIENSKADETRPTVIGNVYKNAYNTGFLVEAKDDGILKEIKYGNRLTPVEFKGQTCKRNFMTYTAIDEFDIYNEGDLYITVQSSSCVVDKKAPAVKKEEENFKWKLIMQDEESGLWKITDSKGEIILKDYINDGYPTTQQEFIVPWGYDEVRVYDAVGNYTSINTNAQEVGTLGYSSIVNPIWSNTYDTDTVYNKVYFGLKAKDNNTEDFTDGTKPILFRVLNTTANDDDNTPALFLLTDYATRWGNAWQSTSYNGSNVWGSSIMKIRYLGGNKPDHNCILYDCFNEKESRVILETTKTEKGDVKWYLNAATANPLFYVAGATNLHEEKLFLLSAKEVIDPRYGFSNELYNDNSLIGTGGNSNIVYLKADKNRVAKAGGTNGSTASWWLRSGSSDGTIRVTFIDASGNPNYTDSGNSRYVRFALNIPLSKIIFTQDAALASPNPTSSTFITITPTASPYRLTIVDEDSEFAITENVIMAGCRETITLHHSNTSIGTGYSIKAIIKQTDDDGVTKGYVAKGDIIDDTVSFTLPHDIKPGKYKMIVYNEFNEGAYKTITAGYDTVQLTVLAKAYAKNVYGTEGVCNIHKPQRNTADDANGTIPSTYDYVYFGKLDGTKKYNHPNNSASPAPTANCPQASYIKTRPIKFRVLDTTSNDESTPALFMLAEHPIGYRRFDTGASNTQKWETSEMRAFLNGTSDGNVLKDCFDERERTVLQETTKRNDKCTYWNSTSYISRTKNGTDKTAGINQDVYCKLNKDKVFLLSTEELLNKNYGFCNSYSISDVNKKVDERYGGGLRAYWWTRSAIDYTGNTESVMVACVSCDGGPVANGYNSYSPCYTVRFALNVELNKVLFTEDAKEEGYNSLTLVKDRPLSGSSEFKLTILDTSSPRASFACTSVSPTPASGVNSASNPIVMSHGGEIMEIGYEKAVTGENEYISAIIRRTSDGYEEFEGGNYYGVLKKSTDASGTVKLTIPEGIPEGKYKVMILNEQRNGAYCTNYANKFDIYIEIQNTLEDQTKPFVIDKAYRNAKNTGFSLKVKDNGILQRVQYGDDPVVINLKGQLERVNFTTQTAITEFDIYNEVGLNTTVQSSACVVDSEAPAVMKEEGKIGVTGEEFHWKLTMQDEGSGLWKITDSTGDIIIKDYSLDGYPTVQEEFIVPWLYDSVRVYDAVGNSTLVKTNAREIGTLGYCNIKDPVWSGDRRKESTYDYVYFGTANSNYFNDTGKGIQFKVLNTKANDDYGTPALFLMTCCETKTNKVFDNRGSGNTIWNSSNVLKPYLYGTGSGDIYINCFSQAEKNAILSTKKKEIEDEKRSFLSKSINALNYARMGATDINNEKLFLLSGKEMVDPKYGFSNMTYAGKIEGTTSTGEMYMEDINRKCWYTINPSSSISPSPYFLRSASTGANSTIVNVTNTGAISTANVSDNCYIRFALNVPLSKVLYNSNYADTYVNPTTSPFATANPSGPYKLTIVDGSGFAIAENNVVAVQGETITLNFTCDTAINSVRGIIKYTDEDGVTKGYTARGSVSGTKVSFTVPTTVPTGRYKMIVYSETNGGAYYTNTGKYDTLTLTVVASGSDTTAPELLNVYVNDEGTCYRVTAKDDMGLSRLISGSSDKDISYLRKKGTANIETAKNAGVNVYDIENQYTPTIDSEITYVDSTPPTYTITYDQGDYIIRVSDTESGIWKITDSTGQIILKDWSR